MKRSMPLRPASGLASRLGHLLAILLLVLMAADAAAKDRVVYYHNDALGSPVAATGESGQVLWREDYAPYGKRLLREDGESNRLWYTGKEEEESLGLYYYGARWYDADIGRFLERDPAGFQEGNPQSFNSYAYANNNPYRYVDPDGKFAIVAAILAATATYFIANHAMDAYNGQASLMDTGVSSRGLAAAAKSIATDGAITAAIAAGAEWALGGRVVAEAISGVAKGETTVIGRVKDLQNLKQGEKSLLDRLPDQGSPKANWKQNSGVLRQEMAKGQPIRDASPGDTAGQFLNAERNLLKDRGWTFDPKINHWNPPAQ